MTTLFAAPACAQEDQSATATPVAMVTETAANTNVEILRDAHRPANAWVVNHPDRLAVSVRIGEETLVAPERVEEVLRQDFASRGLTNVRFFFETGAPVETVVAYHTDNYVYGPYALGVARDHVGEAVEGLRFNQTLTASLN